MIYCRSWWFYWEWAMRVPWLTVLTLPFPMHFYIRDPKPSSKRFLTESRALLVLHFFSTASQFDLFCFKHDLNIFFALQITIIASQYCQVCTYRLTISHSITIFINAMLDCLGLNTSEPTPYTPFIIPNTTEAEIGEQEHLRVVFVCVGLHM